MAKAIRNLFQKSYRGTKSHRSTSNDSGETNAEPLPTADLDPKVVEERAYFLWRDAGCPGGRDIHFWLLAEEQLRAECAR